VRRDADRGGKIDEDTLAKIKGTHLDRGMMRQRRSDGVPADTPATLALLARLSLEGSTTREQLTI
jgi:hypothetical protein